MKDDNYSRPVFIYYFNGKLPDFKREKKHPPLFIRNRVYNIWENMKMNIAKNSPYFLKGNLSDIIKEPKKRR